MHAYIITSNKNIRKIIMKILMPDKKIRIILIKHLIVLYNFFFFFFWLLSQKPLKL